MGTVTDDGWSLEDAKVVCRQLGYQTQGVEYFWWAYFGQGTGPILLDNVGCSGNESQLLNCSYGRNTTDNTHSEDASVSCPPHNCQDGDVRLIGGQSAYEGRLEVCLSRRWGAVSDEEWSIFDAQVACKQLGYKSSGAKHYVYPHEGPLLVLLQNVTCNGSESKLLDCDSITVVDNDQREDAGLLCSPYSCQDGYVRLVGGQSAYEGRVEVCLSQRWGTVTDDGWSMVDAQVVCKQLGYKTDGATSYYGAHFGQGTGPILLDNVGCSGSEVRLINCSYSMPSSSDNHYEDAGVRCTPAPCQDGDVRLVGGQSAYEGRVEVCLSQRWGTVSSDGWSEYNSQVICKYIGFNPNGTKYYSHLNPVTGPPVILESVTCSGSESGLLSCSYSVATGGALNHNGVVAVECLPYFCHDGDMRLVGGKSAYEGRVEVCFSQRWGTVCGDGWSLADSQVVCSQLGYPSSTAPRSYMVKHEAGPQFIKNVGCYGLESILLNCSHSRDIQTQCDVIEVHCVPGFSSTIMQIEMIGDITCSTYFISTHGASIETSLTQQIVAQVKCPECTFTVTHIQDGRLTCCGNRLDTVAYQARIISSQDVSLDTIKTAIQEWVASEPALPGWESVLKIPSTWQYNLSENILHVQCGTEGLSEEQKQDELKVSTIILVILALLVIIIIVVVVVFVVLKCRKKKHYSAESVRFQNRNQPTSKKEKGDTEAYTVSPEVGKASPAGAHVMIRDSSGNNAGKAQQEYELMTIDEVIYEVPA